MRGLGLRLKDRLAACSRLADGWLMRYRHLREREQKLLAWAAVLLSLAVMVSGVLMPLHEWRMSLAGATAALQQQAQDAERMAAQLKARPSTGGDRAAKPADLLSLVEQLARKTGVRGFMSGIQPQFPAGGGGQSLLVKLRNAPYADVLHFMNELAVGQLKVARLKMKAGSTDGVVHVQLVVSH